MYMYMDDPQEDVSPTWLECDGRCRANTEKWATLTCRTEPDMQHPVRSESNGSRGLGSRFDSIEKMLNTIGCICHGFAQLLL